MYIFDNQTNDLVEIEIVEALYKDMPLKKEAWFFNWKQAFKKVNTTTYILRLVSNPDSIQGILQLQNEFGMIIMDLLEIAPHNLRAEGKAKKYEYVAGCLIAFACRETFKLDTDYRGFLTFESKTKLISWYVEKYHAKVARGQKMYIEPQDGEKLIKEYLERKK